jgi:hypothetical protein
MPPRIRQLNPGFSTADGDFATFDYDEKQYARLSFEDWQQNTVAVLFKDVIAIKWQMVEELIPGEPQDGSCEILDSPWIALHRSEGAIESGDQVHHYKFNFNSYGSFELICSGYRLENERKYAKGVWDT